MLQGLLRRSTRSRSSHDNGIDSLVVVVRRTIPARPDAAASGRRPSRSVVSSAESTRRKGLPLFLRACAALPPDVQLVLCAGAPDTPEHPGRGQRPTVAALAATTIKGVVMDLRDAPACRRGRPARRRDGVRLPVDVRAARHRQLEADGRDRVVTATRAAVRRGGWGSGRWAHSSRSGDGSVIVAGTGRPDLDRRPLRRGTQHGRHAEARRLPRWADRRPERPSRLSSRWRTAGIYRSLR